MCDWFLNLLHSKEPVPTIDSRTEHVFVEAWRRTNSRPQLDSRLWTELNRWAIETGQNGSSKNPVAERNGIVPLSQLNRRIQSYGDRNRLMNAVREAIGRGKPRLARKLMYRCLLASPACLVDVNWLRQFAKAHLGQRLSRKLQNIISNRGRRYNKLPLAANR